MKASELSGDNGIGIPSSKSKSQTGGCVIVAVEFVTSESERYNAMIQTRDENASAAVFFSFRWSYDYEHHGSPFDKLQLAKRHFGLWVVNLSWGWRFSCRVKFFELFHVDWWIGGLMD